MASKSYQASETSTVWTDSGGDKLMDMGGLATGALVMGAYLDLGVSPRADWYEFVVKIDGMATNPLATAKPFEIFVSQSNSSTGFDGQPTTDPTAIAEGTITEDQARNCKLCGTMSVVSAVNTDVLQARFVCRLTGRYISPILLNSATASLNAIADTHTITITPIPQES